MAYISVNNVSTTPLSNGQTFAGDAEINHWPSVLVWVNTDQTGILYCEFSTDKLNWDTSLSFNYDPNRINPPHIFEKGYRFFRVRFTNDSGSDQTYFRLSTSYGNFNKLTSPINGVIAETYDATNVRPTKYEYEVAMSKRQGRSTWNKWGYNSDIDSAAPEILADYGGSFDPLTDIITTAQTFTITYNNTTDGSGTTGALSLLIYYIDENDDLLLTGTHTLGSTGSDVTSFSGKGINRAIVLSNGGAGTNTNAITITATTDTTTQANIPAGDSVTQQCLFHVPINHTFLADWMLLNFRKLTGGSAPRITIRAWSYSRVTLTKYEVFRFDVDTNIKNHLEIRPSQPFPIGGREVFWLEAETNTNDTVVGGSFSGILERVS